MDIESKYFQITCTGPELENVKQEILKSGPFYTGSIGNVAADGQYKIFSHVNKEAMEYILNTIDTTEEVKIEILAHDGNPKFVQSKDYWTKFRI